MNYKMTLIDALALLYWENQIPAGTDNKALIKNVLQYANPSKDSLDSDKVKEIYEGIQVLILKMSSNEQLCKNKELIIQNIRMLAMEEPYVVEIVEGALNLKLDEAGIKNHCRSLIQELNDVIRKADFRKRLQTISKEVFYGDGDFKLNEIARSLITQVEAFAVDKSDRPEHTPGVMDFVDFDNPESMIDIFTRARNQISPDEIIKFGLQGLNKMFGEQMGGRRGEMVLIGGLQHHFKSGLAMGMTRGAALYNIPKLKDPTKKPAIVLISSENDLPINMQTLYKQCYEQEVGHTIKKSEIDPTEAAKYMKAKFAENGWHFLMFRINPDEFTFSSLQSLTLGLEADGYEIIVMTFDYLAMMSTKGFDNGGITGRDKQAMFKRTRNFMVMHHILFITPHQLSTEALGIERDRPNQFLNEILNRAYYNECKTIAQEVDFEINIQKQIVDGIAYLNLGRGKHRGVDNTPLENQRCTYRFTDIGIPDDVLGEDQSMKKPGANTHSQGGGPAWHQTIDQLNDFVLN